MSEMKTTTTRCINVLKLTHQKLYHIILLKDLHMGIINLGTILVSGIFVFGISVGLLLSNLI